jgi:hypothetical protein
MLRFYVIAPVILGAWTFTAADEPKLAVATPAQAEKSAPERAWDDLRWIMTALEAYAIDNDEMYAPVGAPREGAVADLDQRLDWHYKNTYPKRSSPPRLDPWGRPYRFVFSRSGKRYALYSAGANGKLDRAEKAFVMQFKKSEPKPNDQEAPKSSGSVIVAAGSLRFAPAEILEVLKQAK